MISWTQIKFRVVSKNSFYKRVLRIAEVWGNDVINLL